MGDYLLENVSIATCCEPDATYGLIRQGAVAVKNQQVSWCGPKADLPNVYRSLPAKNLNNRLLTPALIDCHTHIVHGGNRAEEFEQRLNGVTYAEISASGGGIVSTMSATRNADVESLVQSALPRVDALLAEGVSTIEVKSGYGLDTHTELNMLRAARQLQELRPIHVVTSFLGAHATPSEYKNRSDEYIDEVCIPALERAVKENLVDAVDGFCESIAFSPEQIERVFKKAAAHNLPLKLHAEQLSLSGGAKLAARYKALSADHLEYLDESGAKAMADAGTVAVLLPGAFYTLRESQHPPIELLRQYKVPMAIATDCNPGSSPITSLLLVMNMACTLFGLTPEEAFLGATKNAAKALGLNDRGTIAQGMRADFAVWDVDHPAELSYRIGFNPLIERIA